MTLRLLLAVLAVTALPACGSSAVPKEASKTPAVASQAAPPAGGMAPSASNENRFYNPVAGVSIEKRSSWAFMPLSMELANRKAVSVGKEETDAAMHDASTPPLVVIARYPEPSEKPNPTLKINLRPLAEMKGASPVEIGRTVAAIMAKAIPSFELDGGVLATQISGLDAATFRAHFTVDFTVEVPRLQRSFAITTQAWIVPRGDDGFTSPLPIRAAAQKTTRPTSRPCSRRSRFGSSGEPHGLLGSPMIRNYSRISLALRRDDRAASARAT